MFSSRESLSIPEKSPEYPKGDLEGERLFKAMIHPDTEKVEAGNANKADFIYTVYIKISIRCSC